MAATCTYKRPVQHHVFYPSTSRVATCFVTCQKIKFNTRNTCHIGISLFESQTSVLKASPSLGISKPGRSKRFPLISAVVGQQESTIAKTKESQRSELKTVLKECLEKTNGNLSESSLEIISSLEKLNPTSQPAENPKNYNGDFILLNSSMNGVLYKGAVIALGRATFNAFGPVKLKIKMEDVFNYIGTETESSYLIEIRFTIAEEGVPPLKGKLLNKAECHKASSDRLDVIFLSSSLMPENPETDLTEWMKVFGDLNPSIDKNGVVLKELPAFKGWLDITYLDDELRITRGNNGTIIVVNRI